MKNFYTFNLLLAALLAVAAFATYEPAPKTSGRLRDSRRFIRISECLRSGAADCNCRLCHIVAGAYNYSDASGHVVIVTGIDLSTGGVSAMGTVGSSYIGDNGFGNNMVNNNGWHDNKHYSPGIRRYVGK